MAALTGVLWPAFVALAVPGAATMGLLVWPRRRTGDPLREEAQTAGLAPAPTSLRRAGRQPPPFWLFAASAGLAAAGLVTFGLISYHLVHDRFGGRGLLVLPVLVAAVPALAFSNARPFAFAGVLLWGAATGLQDSTVKALVAQLVPAGRRATGYGMFAAVQGVAAVAGGALAGELSTRSLPALITVVAAVAGGALALLAGTLRTTRA